MTDNEYEKKYYEELDVIREYENRNDINRDTALLQLSIGLLAVLAAFGENILKSNRKLSYLIVVSLGITVLTIITGFITTKEMFRAIRLKMDNNVSEGKEFYDSYTDNNWQTANSILNVTSIFSFFIASILILVLIIIYIGGANG